MEHAFIYLSLIFDYNRMRRAFVVWTHKAISVFPDSSAVVFVFYFSYWFFWPQLYYIPCKPVTVRWSHASKPGGCLACFWSCGVGVAFAFPWKDLSLELSGERNFPEEGSYTFGKLLAESENAELKWKKFLWQLSGICFIAACCCRGRSLRTHNFFSMLLSTPRPRWDATPLKHETKRLTRIRI